MDFRGDGFAIVTFVAELMLPSELGVETFFIGIEVAARRSPLNGKKQCDDYASGFIGMH